MDAEQASADDVERPENIEESTGCLQKKAEAASSREEVGACARANEKMNTSVNVVLVL